VKPLGGLTNIKPGGTDLIQNVAIVSRVSTQTGELEVIALGRTNDVPNLPEGRLFVGTAANTSLASDVVYVDDANDRVGINTATPGADLEVVGVDGVIIHHPTASTGPAKLTLKGTGTGGGYGGGATVDVIGGALDYMSYALSLKNSPSTLEATNKYAQLQGQWSWDGNKTNNRSQPYTSYDFRTQGSSQMTIYNNNVGIGTTSPGSKLEVSGGDISLRSNATYIKSTDNNGAENRVLGINSSNTMYIGPIDPYQGGGIIYGASASVQYHGFYGGGSEKVRINSNGNVGIGTTNPITSLTLGTGSSVISFQSSSTTLNSGKIAVIKQIELGNGNGNLTFETYQGGSGGGERMRILNNGNVGIGTINPGAKLDVAGNIIVSGGVSNENDGVRVTNPGGASSISANSNVAGAIKITLPQAGINTMMRMEVKVYEYLTNESFTVQCGGYFNSGSSWFNEYAYIESSAKDDRNFTVRFGYDGSKGIIYIGELSSFWGYPQVFVTEFQGGFQNATALNYLDGWDIGFETGSFSGVSKTQANTQINNWARSGANIYFASSTGNVGIGTTNPNVKLEIGGGSTLARVIPAITNQGYIGDSNHRWQAIYATNGTIQTSDIREKTEIKPTKLGLDFINDLKPVSYKWTEGERLDASKDERNHQGLIAQEVAETLEKHGVDKNKFGGLDIQKTDEYDDFHAMSYEQLIAPMIKAIQELKTEIEELKKQINK